MISSMRVVLIVIRSQRNGELLLTFPNTRCARTVPIELREKRRWHPSARRRRLLLFGGIGRRDDINFRDDG